MGNGCNFAVENGSEELDDGAGLAVDGKGDDVAAVDGVEGGGELIAQLGGDAVLDAHVADLKALGQQLHGDAHVVGVVHVTVVVDVGPHDLDGWQHGALGLGRDDAAAAVVHLLLGLERERGDGTLGDACQLAGGEVDKRAHAPRAVAVMALGITDEGVAEAVHRHHLIDGGRDRQFLLESGYAHDLDLPGGQQLGHIVVIEELAGLWLAVDPHLGAILHHLQCRVELQSALAVAAAGGYLVVERVHARKLIVVK